MMMTRSQTGRSNSAWAGRRIVWQDMARFDIEWIIVRFLLVRSGKCGSTQLAAFYSEGVSYLLLI